MIAPVKGQDLKISKVNRLVLNGFITRSAFPKVGAQSRAAKPSRRDAERSGAPLTG